MIYFIIRTLNAVYELIIAKKDNRQTVIRKLANFLYTTLIFPVGAVCIIDINIYKGYFRLIYFNFKCVTIQFWGIYLANRDLIFPKILDEVIPAWHNHILHTLPLVAAVADNLMTRHVYKKSFISGVIPTVIYAIAYLTWYQIFIT